jgi:hypothetical protein
VSSTKGSGAGRPSPERQNEQSNKDKGSAPKVFASDREAPARAESPGTNRQRPFVVCSNSSHPDCEPGTFDAAALLKSVLSVIEPVLEEGFRSLEQSLLESINAQADERASRSHDLRTVGRQISEALRAGVIEGMRTRERHLAKLVLIDRAAVQSQVLYRLQERIGAEIEKAGLRRVVDLDNLAAFNLADGMSTGDVDEAGADAFELVTPAYMDADSGRVIERGWVRRAPEPGAALPQGKAHGRKSRQHKEKKDTADHSRDNASCRTGHSRPSAPIIPASFLIRRLLDDPAEHLQRQRRSS